MLLCLCASPYICASFLPISSLPLPCLHLRFHHVQAYRGSARGAGDARICHTDTFRTLPAWAGLISFARVRRHARWWMACWRGSWVAWTMEEERKTVAFSTAARAYSDKQHYSTIGERRCSLPSSIPRLSGATACGLPSVSHSDSSTPSLLSSLLRISQFHSRCEYPALSANGDRTVSAYCQRAFGVAGGFIAWRGQQGQQRRARSGRLARGNISRAVGHDLLLSRGVSCLNASNGAQQQTGRHSPGQLQHLSS